MDQTIELCQRITLEPNQRGGQPGIRGMRITVYDLLSLIVSGMSHEEILDDYPERELEEVQAAIRYWENDLNN